MSLSPDATLAAAIADCFWVPGDVTVVDEPDLCWLSCPRDLPTVNAVLRTRVPLRDLPDLVDRVRAAHAGRRSRWMVGPLDLGQPLERALDAAGYARSAEHFGYTIGVDAVPGRVHAGVAASAVVDLQGMRDWYAVSCAAFGETLYSGEDELRLFLTHCTGPGARVHRVVAYDQATGQPLSAGGMTLFPELGFGMLWAGGTVPAARGRGAYSAVLRGRLAWARARGLQRVGLYAKVDTSAPIVARLGFQRHGALAFWER